MLTAVVTSAANKSHPHEDCAEHTKNTGNIVRQDQHALITIQDAKACCAMAEG
jgi:hypothetical protein